MMPAVDELVLVSRDDAEDMCRRLARERGDFAGISAAGACWVAQRDCAGSMTTHGCFVVCDRGDCYFPPAFFVMKNLIKKASSDFRISTLIAINTEQCSAGPAFAPLRNAAGDDLPERKTAGLVERLRCRPAEWTHWNNPDARAGRHCRDRWQGAAGAQRGLACKMFCADHRFMEAGESPRKVLPAR